jgi:predicted DNA-binding transcriptional regulator AlpA
MRQLFSRTVTDADLTNKGNSQDEKECDGRHQSAPLEAAPTGRIAALSVGDREGMHRAAPFKHADILGSHHIDKVWSGGDAANYLRPSSAPSTSIISMSGQEAAAASRFGRERARLPPRKSIPPMAQEGNLTDRVEPPQPKDVRLGSLSAAVRALRKTLPPPDPNEAVLVSTPYARFDPDPLEPRKRPSYMNPKNFTPNAPNVPCLGTAGGRPGHIPANFQMYEGVSRRTGKRMSSTYLRTRDRGRSTVPWERITNFSDPKMFAEVYLSQEDKQRLLPSADVRFHAAKRHKMQHAAAERRLFQAARERARKLDRGFSTSPSQNAKIDDEPESLSESNSYSVHNFSRELKWKFPIENRNRRRQRQLPIWEMGPSAPAAMVPTHGSRIWKKAPTKDNAELSHLPRDVRSMVVKMRALGLEESIIWRRVSELSKLPLPVPLPLSHRGWAGGDKSSWAESKARARESHRQKEEAQSRTSLLQTKIQSKISSGPTRRKVRRHLKSNSLDGPKWFEPSWPPKMLNAMRVIEDKILPFLQGGLSSFSRAVAVAGRRSDEISAEEFLTQMKTLALNVPGVGPVKSRELTLTNKDIFTLWNAIACPTKTDGTARSIGRKDLNVFLSAMERWNPPESCYKPYHRPAVWAAHGY